MGRVLHTVGDQAYVFIKPTDVIPVPKPAAASGDQVGTCCRSSRLAMRALHFLLPPKTDLLLSSTQVTNWSEI
jgi:hypothetical protein